MPSPPDLDGLSSAELKALVIVLLEHVRALERFYAAVTQLSVSSVESGVIIAPCNRAMFKFKTRIIVQQSLDFLITSFLVDKRISTNHVTIRGSPNQSVRDGVIACRIVGHTGSLQVHMNCECLREEYLRSWLRGHETGKPVTELGSSKPRETRVAELAGRAP